MLVPRLGWQDGTSGGGGRLLHRHGRAGGDGAAAAGARERHHEGRRPLPEEPRERGRAPARRVAGGGAAQPRTQSARRLRRHDHVCECPRARSAIGGKLATNVRRRLRFTIGGGRPAACGSVSRTGGVRTRELGRTGPRFDGSLLPSSSVVRGCLLEPCPLVQLDGAGLAPRYLRSTGACGWLPVNQPASFTVRGPNGGVGFAAWPTRCAARPITVDGLD